MTTGARSLLLTLGFAFAAACTGPADETATPVMNDSTGAGSQPETDPSVEPSAEPGTQITQVAYIKASNTGHIGERLDPDEQPELAGEHFGPIASGEYRYADSYGEMFDDGDQFGSAIALSDDGKTVIATAQDEDGLTTGINNIPGPDYQDDIRPTTGAVYVFVEEDGAWSQQAYIKASNTGSGDVFGSRLALGADGNVLVVGAQLEDSGSQGVDGYQDDDSALEAGAVYLFRR